MNNETLTKAICNKGFSGNSIILPRIKFCVSRQDTSPLSLTAYSLNRSLQRRRKKAAIAAFFCFYNFSANFFGK